MGFNKDIASSLGPIAEDPEIFSGNIGTTVVAPTQPDGYLSAFGGVIRCKITNLSTSATVAWRLAPRGTAAGSVTLSADPTNAACGVIVAPGDTEYFSYSSSMSLYVVASAATTSVCVSTVLV